MGYKNECTHNGIVFCPKKAEKSAIHNTTDEPGGHYGKWNKTVWKKEALPWGASVSQTQGLTCGRVDAGDRGGENREFPINRHEVSVMQDGRAQWICCTILYMQSTKIYYTIKNSSRG